MKLFCHHQYNDESWTFTPPREHVRYPRWVEGSEAKAMLDRWLMGFTTVLQRCEECEKLRSYVFVGQVTPREAVLVVAQT